MAQKNNFQVLLRTISRRTFDGLTWSVVVLQRCVSQGKNKEPGETLLRSHTVDSTVLPLYLIEQVRTRKRSPPVMGHFVEILHNNFDFPEFSRRSYQTHTFLIGSLFFFRIVSGTYSILFFFERDLAMASSEYNSSTLLQRCKLLRDFAFPLVSASYPRCVYKL